MSLHNHLKQIYLSQRLNSNKYCHSAKERARERERERKKEERAKRKRKERGEREM